MASMIRSQVTNNNNIIIIREKSQTRRDVIEIQSRTNETTFSQWEVPVGSVVEKGAVVLFCTVEGAGL